VRKGEWLKQFKELMVILVTGVGGVALFVLGIKARAVGSGLFGVPVAVAGILMVAFAGYYHYRKDYRGADASGGVVAFLALSAFSALAGVVVVRLLLGG
jgi:hypothetical protein